MYSESQTKVKMTRDSNGDTRHATHIPTISEFNKANELHRSDVKKLIERFCALLKRSSDRHDWSKIEEPYRSMFYRDMVATMEDRIEFEDGEWYRLHCSKLERHHLLTYVPGDVDLFDVIEMVCDCVAAGMARNGEARPLEIADGVFQKALDNTVKILQHEIELTDDE